MNESIQSILVNTVPFLFLLLVGIAGINLVYKLFKRIDRALPDSDRK